MNLSWPVIYLGIFVEALIMSLLLTPRSETIGRKLGLLDRPGKAKIHRETKARSGGLAIFAAFMITFLTGLALAFILSQKEGMLTASVSGLLKNIPHIAPKIIGLTVGAVFIFAVGVIDDRLTLGPWTKLICQILSAIPLIVVGIRIEMFLPFWVGAVLTVFWVVLLTNSLNFLDNMDGLSSGIAVICSLILAIVSWRAGDRFVTALIFAFSGAIIGFWYFNFIKSRLFMGDGGSLFIGYMLGAMTIMATYYDRGVPTGLPVLTPIIILGVPLFDTFTVLLIRFREGRPLMQGDTNHFSHRLVQLGMSRKQAVVFIYFVTLCVGLTSLPLARLALVPALIQTALVVCWFVIIFLLERAAKKG